MDLLVLAHRLLQDAERGVGCNMNHFGMLGSWLDVNGGRLAGSKMHSE